MATKKKMATKKTKAKPSTEESVEKYGLCGECKSFLADTEGCNDPRSPCYGGKVREYALACEFRR